MTSSNAGKKPTENLPVMRELLSKARRGEPEMFT